LVGNNEMVAEMATKMRWKESDPEIIILGSGLGGMIAGTLLSRKNHSVLLLKEKDYQRSYAEKGYRFTPFSSLSEKSLKRALLRRLSQALNLPLMSERQGVVDSVLREERLKSKDLDIRKQKVAFQVVLPRARIDLYSQESQFQREWSREFPKEVIQIKKFYEEMDDLQHLLMKMKAKEDPWSFFPLQPRSLIQRWLSFKRLQKGRIDKRLSPLSTEFRQFIQLQLLSWGNLFSDQLPIALAAYDLFPNEELNELIPTVDIEKLEVMILKEFLKTGGRVEEIERMERVSKEWRKEFVISLEGDQRVFRSKVLVLNLPLHRSLKLMDGRKGRLSKWGKRIQPLYILIPFFLGIREKVIPVGMRDLLISISNLEKPYHAANLLFLSLSPKGHETTAPVGRRALTVESLVPLEEWDQTSLGDHQKGVMKHLEQLFPFLENYIDFSNFSWAGEQVPRWSYPHFLFKTTSKFRWREGVVPIRMSRNLFFIGKENFPYLGLEGEVFSGLMVAEQILQKYQ
jgi:phytoene dehydrogenase-like protein